METPNLFTPLTLRGLTLRNRIAISPMQQYIAKDGIIGEWHYVHLGSRAVGGAGLIITECTAVSPEGMNTPDDTGLWNDEQVQAWTPLIRFVQQQGTKIGVQLWHAGAKGSQKHFRGTFSYVTPEEGGRITKGASPMKLNDKYQSLALTLPEIRQIKSEFVLAAKRAVEAGFDTIELHGGHGYIFHQFYSAAVNHREDEYGGSFENRIRLLTETVLEVRKAIPESMPLLVRISAVDHLEGLDAWQIEDSEQLSIVLKEIGVDLITTSAGGFAFVDKSKVFPNYQVPYAEKIKATGMVTGAVGLITEADQANKIITEGQADLVLIGREALRDPYFPINAARELNLPFDLPEPYRRAYQ